MAYAAKVLADSVSYRGHRLTTMEVTFPRIVLAEFNTHRMFSRNSASSRAIPVEKRIAAVRADPFIPEQFGKNQKGMQATENLTEQDALDARDTWVCAMDSALEMAEQMANNGVHKQIANRLIEPFCWHTVIVSATEWENFWGLRCSPMAQPEIRKIAELMREAYRASVPTERTHREWHLPLIQSDVGPHGDLESGQDLCMVSAGRCARVSYLTHDGRRDPVADVALASKLAADGHMSPFEHVARPMKDWELVEHATKAGPFLGNFQGWVQLRKIMPNESNFAARK